MKASWKTKPFADVVNARGSGAGGLPQKQWAEAGRFPVIGQGDGDIEGWTDRKDLLITPNPALVLYGGHTRRAKHVMQPFVPGPNVRILTPSPDLDARFLFYFLTQLPVPSKGYADHFPMVRKCEVRYPPLPEQRRIVAILDEAFEGIAVAKANADRNLRNAREVFVAALEQQCGSEKEEWREITVEQAVEEGIIAKPFDGNHGEIHPKRADYTPSGVPFVMACDLKNGGVDIQNCTFISPRTAQRLRVGRSKNGDVLLSHKGTIGRIAILSTTDEYVMLTPQVTAYRILDPSRLLNGFLYYYFRSDFFQRRLGSAAADGSTRAYVGITKQRSLPLRLPPMSQQRETLASLTKLEAEVAQLELILVEKPQLFDELKNSLLHQAFTGQL